MGSHWREVIGKAKVVLGCSRKHLGKAAAKTGVIVSILSLVVSFASYKQSLERHIEDAEEKRIEDLEKQPSFAWDETLADSENHYIIRNTGGDIRYGKMLFDPVCEISLFDKQARYFGTLLWDRYSDIITVPYDFEKGLFDVSGEITSEPLAQWEETIQNTASEAGYYCLVNWTQRYRVEYQDYKQETKSRELIARDGELCDFKDGEANSFRIWLEMKESGENLLGYMVKSGIEGLEKKNGIGENGISQATL